MNWFELKSLCIEKVANEMVPSMLPEGHNRDVLEVRSERWKNLARELEPKAIEAIQMMNGLQLLDLISEVVGEHG
jgi:hypothetical protein